MDIIVCIKRGPDTETRVKVAADGHSLVASGVSYICAPYDESAVEKAIQLRDAAGSGSITVVTVGPAAATKELRTALAMGADAALHVTSDADLGAMATAKALQGVIQGKPCDLILCGRQATDADNAAVGPMLAALLDLPCVAFVGSIEASDGKVTVTREVEGETEVLEVATPCVLTAQKSLAEPRLPGLKGIMAAKKKPLETVDLPEVASRCVVKSLALPEARSAVTMIDASPEGMKTLLTALRNEKKVL